MGRRLGDPDDPLLVSVRSGREVLDAGDDGDGPRRRAQRRVGARPGPAERRRALRPRLLPAAAPDVRQHRARHRRREPFADALDELKRRARRRRRRSTSTPTTSGSWSTTYKARDPRAAPAATSPRTRASSSTSRSARSSTRGTPTARGPLPPAGADPRGPRHRGQRAGDGLRQPRRRLRLRRLLHPRPRHRRAGRLRRLPAERPGRGRRRRHPQHRAARRPAELDQASYDELLGSWPRSSSHYRDMCDIEFTIEGGKLWMLQTRVGKRTPEAAFRIACDMVDEGLIDLDEALRRVTGAPARRADVPAVRRRRRARALLTTGMNASPGAAVGRVGVRLRDRGGVGRARRGRDPGPQGDRPRRPARAWWPRAAILTSRGGKTSHAAVVARGMGRTCVCGAEALEVDVAAAAVHGPRRPDRRGGRRDLHRRHAPARSSSARSRSVDPAVVRRLRGRGRSTTRWSTPWPGCWTTPTRVRRLAVRANADTAGRRRPGAAVRRRGHRAVPHRAHVPRRAPRAGRAPDRRRGRGRRRRRRSTQLLPLQRRGLHRDPRGDGRAAGHHPADRPAPARVPARPHRALGAGGARGRAAHRGASTTTSCSIAVRRLHEQNPMLGPARRPARHRDPRPVRDAGAGDRSRPRPTGIAGRRRPAPGDHGPAGRQRCASSRWCAPSSRRRSPPGRGRARRAAVDPRSAP